MDSTKKDKTKKSNKTGSNGTTTTTKLNGKLVNGSGEKTTAKLNSHDERKGGNFLKNLFRPRNRRSKSTTPNSVRQHSSSPSPPSPPSSVVGTVQIRTVEIIKRPGQNLGFYLRDGNGLDRTGGIFVSRIADHSPLAKNSLIKTGDEILAVNSMPTSSMKIEDCVYIISLSSKLLITVRSLPFDPSKNAALANGREFDATPRSIVVNHHFINNKQQQSDVDDNKEQKSSSEHKTPLSPKQEMVTPTAKQGADQKQATSPEKRRGLLMLPHPDYCESILSSSDENVHLTTLQKMESQFNNKKISPTREDGEVEESVIEPPPPLPPPPPPPPPPPHKSHHNHNQNHRQLLPMYFNQKPQRFRSVEEFTVTSDSYYEPAPAPESSRRLLMPVAHHQEAGCTCGHQQSSYLPNYRGLTRPTPSYSNLVTSVNNNTTMDYGANCYNCIRFGAANCPNHYNLTQRRNHHFNNNGYVSDNGFSSSSSIMTSRAPYQRGRHQHFMTTGGHPYASSSSNIYYNDAAVTDAESPPETTVWYQQLPHFHPSHHSSTSAINYSSARRPNCLEVTTSSTDDDDDDDEVLEQTTTNQRLQFLLMQQEQQAMKITTNLAALASQQPRKPSTSSSTDSGSSYPTFHDYKRVESFASPPSPPDQEAANFAIINGQLNLNVQAFYCNNDGGEATTTSAEAATTASSLLSSLYLAVFIDGQPCGKTAARIGLKSFYFNEMLSVNVTPSNRHVTFIIYNYYGTTKLPQQRASANCQLGHLCRKENTMKVAIPTYPNGTIFLRWLFKERQQQLAPDASLQQSSSSSSPVRTLITNNELSLSNGTNPPHHHNHHSSSPVKTATIRGSNGHLVKTATGGKLISRKVFGIPLGELVDSEWKLGLLSCHVPILVQLCTRILNTCANVEGLYSRLSPPDERQYLRECFEQTVEPKHLTYLCEKLMKFDCRVVSDLLLDFFDEMPEPLFPNQLGEEISSNFLNKMSTDMPYIDRQMVVRQFLLECAPKYVAETFQTLIDHIFLLSVNSNVNKLNAAKLDAIFSPLIFPATTTAKNNNTAASTSGAEQSSLLLSPSTTTSASSVSSSSGGGSSALSSPPQKQASLFSQLLDIMFPTMSSTNNNK